MERKVVPFGVMSWAFRLVAHIASKANHGDREEEGKMAQQPFVVVVKDTGSGPYDPPAPIPTAKVCIGDASIPCGSPICGSHAGHQVSGDGLYTENLAAGTYHVCVKAVGYYNEGRSDRPHSSSEPTLEEFFLEEK